MSSLPTEVLEDVLLALDRRTLDDAQFTNRRFLHVVTERLSEVCLRPVAYASFRVPSKNENADSTGFIRIDGPPERVLSKAHVDTVRLFSEFMYLLQMSRVAYLTLNGLVFTPELAALVLQAPISAGRLVLEDGSCTHLTPLQFHKVLVHLSPTSLDVKTCQLRACQVTDELIRALSKNRVRCLNFGNLVPVDGGSFHVTDDAIVDFYAQADVQLGSGGLYGQLGGLILHRGSFTRNLFKRLVEASSLTKRTQPIRIAVSLVQVEEEDLRDFAQHLTYRYRGHWRQQRVYDFPEEPQGEGAAMHTQIVLHPGNTLVLYRAPRQHYAFNTPNE